MKNKIILIDNTSIVEYSQRIETFTHGFGNNYLNILFSSLRRLLIRSEDIIILTVSDKTTWRSSYGVLYKNNHRKTPPPVYDCSKWLTMLHNYTPFHILQYPNMESEDIIAGLVKLFRDREIIIVSSREIFKQLTLYPNIKIFSPISKNFIEVKNPQRAFNNFIIKQLESFIGSNLNEKAYEEARFKYDLIHINSSIEDLLKQDFGKLLVDKSFNFNGLSVYNQKQIMSIYTNPKEPKIKKNKKYKELTLL